MRIKNKTRQHRRDFWAIYECEHCGHETDEKSGYDDSYFHNTVIPKMKCENCDKTASDDYSPMQTRYPDGLVV